MKFIAIFKLYTQIKYKTNKYFKNTELNNFQLKFRYYECIVGIGILPKCQ